MGSLIGKAPDKIFERVVSGICRSKYIADAIRSYMDDNRVIFEPCMLY